MLEIAISCYLLSIILFGLAGYIQGKDKGSSWSLIILLVATGSFLLANESHKSNLREKEMLRRLNQPVSSVDQLHGYEILDIRFFTKKTSSEALAITSYFVDLKDLIPPQRGVLINIELTERVYKDERVAKGARFFPEDPSPPQE